MDPFIGELKLFPYGVVPTGWRVCDGSLLPIIRNQALYALIGVTYGGDGISTFAIPDLRGRVPIHKSTQFPLGNRSGEDAHTLSIPEMPAHTHQAIATSAVADKSMPENQMFAETSIDKLIYSNQAPNANLRPTSIDFTGQSQAHENRQPYLALQFCIAVMGIFPSRP